MMTTTWLLTLAIGASSLVLPRALIAGQSPSDVVKAAFTAANEGRYSDTEQYLATDYLADSRTDLGRSFGGLSNPWNYMTRNRSIAKIEILKEEIDKEKATVFYRLGFKDESVQEKAQDLVNESGAWKLTEDKARERKRAESQLRIFLEAVRKDDVKTIFDHTWSCQESVSSIKSDKPKALWPKLINEIYESFKKAYLEGGTPSMGAFISTYYWKDLLELRRLLILKPEFEITESRPMVKGIIYDGPRIGYIFYISVRYSDPGTSPSIEHVVSNQMRSDRLKETILEVQTDLDVFYAGSSRVKDSDVFWGAGTVAKPGGMSSSPPPLPSPAQAPTPVAPVPTPPGLPVNADWWKAMCPAGKPGEFHHGTRCVGYYDYDEKAQKWKVVEILLLGEEPTKNYKKTKGLVHAGADVAAVQGSEIHPIADGTVSDAISDTSDKNFGSLGYMVIVQHKDKSDGKDTFSLYLHMKDPPKVQKGQAVTAGKDVLGYVGQTGAAFGEHVHVEVRHFPDRFFVNWRNIYGITSPVEEATFNADEFASNWIDPEKFASASLQTTTPAPVGAANAPNPTGHSVQTPYDKYKAKLIRQAFNDHVREYAYSTKRVWDAVQQTLAAQGDKVSGADRKELTIFTNTDRLKSTLGGTIDMYFIWLEKTGDQSTKLYLYLSKFRNAQGDTENNSIVDKSAEDFMDKVNQALSATGSR